MLINLSNHPLEKWDVKQKKAANSQFGDITDIAFPHIDPKWPTPKIIEQAREYVKTCLYTFGSIPDKKNAVHIMGEFTFVHAAVAMLQKAGIHCVVSTSWRNVVETEANKKLIEFNFVQFRNYPDINTYE